MCLTYKHIKLLKLKHCWNIDNHVVSCATGPQQLLLYVFVWSFLWWNETIEIFSWEVKLISRLIKIDLNIHQMNEFSFSLLNTEVHLENRPEKRMNECCKLVTFGCVCVFVCFFFFLNSISLMYDMNPTAKQWLLTIYTEILYENREQMKVCEMYVSIKCYAQKNWDLYVIHFNKTTYSFRFNDYLIFIVNDECSLVESDLDINENNIFLYIFIYIYHIYEIFHLLSSSYAQDWIGNIIINVFFHKKYLIKKTKFFGIFAKCQIRRHKWKPQAIFKEKEPIERRVMCRSSTFLYIKLNWTPQHVISS